MAYSSANRDSKSALQYKLCLKNQSLIDDNSVCNVFNNSTFCKIEERNNWEDIRQNYDINQRRRNLNSPD